MAGDHVRIHRDHRSSLAALRRREGRGLQASLLAAWMKLSAFQPLAALTERRSGQSQIQTDPLPSCPSTESFESVSKVAYNTHRRDEGVRRRGPPRNRLSTRPRTPARA